MLDLMPSATGAMQNEGYTQGWLRQHGFKARKRRTEEERRRKTHMDRWPSFKTRARALRGFGAGVSGCLKSVGSERGTRKTKSSGTMKELRRGGEEYIHVLSVLDDAWSSCAQSVHNSCDSSAACPEPLQISYKLFHPLQVS